MPENTTQNNPSLSEDLYNHPAPPLKAELHYPDRTRRVPLMISMPYPSQYPMLKFPAGTTFFNTDDYFVDENARVYFHDWKSGKDVYLSEIESTNHVQRNKASMVLNNLSRQASVLNQSETKRDTVVYARRVELEFLKQESTVAESRQNRTIVFSLNRHGKGISDNIYEIVTTFRHELIHIRDKHPETYIKQTSENMPFDIHAAVYKEQMKYEEFCKTSLDYQFNRILMYARMIISFCSPKNNFDTNLINRFFADFNREFSKKEPDESNKAKRLEASISFQYDTKPEKQIITIRINDQKKRYIFKRQS